MSRFMWMVCLCLLAAGCASTQGPAHNNTPDATSGLPSLASLPVGDQLDVAEKTYQLQHRYIAASGRRCARLSGESGEIRIACADLMGQWYLRESLVRSSRVAKRLHSTAPSLVQVAGESTINNVVELPTADNYPSSDAGTDQATAEADAQTVKETPAVTESQSEVSVIVPLDDDLSETDVPQVEVRQDETLWRFAKRVTGNALNWEKIAAYNNIDDAIALQAGQRLAIPPDLPLVGSDN